MNITITDFQSILPIILFFVLSFFILILSLYLIPKSGKGKDKRLEDHKNLFSWIEKKDLLYWLLIICLTAISGITYQYSGDKDALSHWSFAGTIVSIILAVVAIGFTLFQTLASNLSSEKIAVSAEKIEKASNGLNAEELNKAGEIITRVSSDILNFNETLQNQIHQLNEELTSMKNEQKEYYSKFDPLFVNLEKNESLEDDITLIKLSKSDFINKVYKKMPMMQQFYLYSLFMFKHKGIEFPSYPNPDEDFLSKFDEFILVNMTKKYPKEFVKGVNFGTLLSVMGWLRFLGYDRKTNTFPKEIHDGLMEHGREFYKGDESYLEFIDDFIAYLGNEQ